MSGKGILALVLAVLLVLGGVGIAIGAYQAGLAAGVAQGGGTVVAPSFGYGWHPGGFASGFFGFLGVLLFIVLVIALVRALAFGRGFDGRGRGPWGGGRWVARDAAFEAWHRRLHETGGDTGDAADRDRAPGSGGPTASW